MKMVASDGPQCPFPAAGGTSPHPAPESTGEDSSCPVGPQRSNPSPEWDVEAHAEAMRRAHQSAATSHLEASKAEEMAVKAAEQRAARKGMDEIRSDFLASLGKKLGYGHPLSDRTALPRFEWTPEAEARLAEVPEFCRDLTRWRVEWTALKHNLGTTITPEIMEIKYQMWGEVSHAIQARHGQQLEWTESARARFAKVPEFVQGQVVEAVEGNARQMGAAVVDDSVVDQVIARWSSTGDFHEGLYGFR